VVSRRKAEAASIEVFADLGGQLKEQRPSGGRRCLPGRLRQASCRRKRYFADRCTERAHLRFFMERRKVWNRCARLDGVAAVSVSAETS